FLESRSGAYWVATRNGLCRFNPDASSQAVAGAPGASQRFVVYYPSEDPSARDIGPICEDQAGTIWCGTAVGLYRLDQIDGKWAFSFIDIIQPINADNRGWVRALVEDRQGSLWVGVENALYRMRPNGVVERYTVEEGLPEKGNGRALLVDRAG